MADTKNAPVTDDEGWEEVKVDLGTEWDFEKYGDLVAIYMGPKEIELPEEKQTINADGTKREKALVHEFAVRDTGEQVFIWGSYQIDLAMTDPGMGDEVKIKFEGYRDFDGGSKRVKQYKVFTKKR